ncbi:hypothetical protein ACFYWY_25735 [Streptomyces sp. NPDC002870]|uniref:hypothetical protein n=1 Tax=Streptomyces sp. NPDC002870 TaxID=3364666 RepID=UPI0036B460BC
MAKKKLVIIKGARAAHRACRLLTGGEPAASAAPPGRARKQKQMSRTELLRRIQELRERDAKKKPQAKGQPRPRPKAKASTKRATSPTIAPQPYYGVEMKSVDGRWVQMHPESE